MMINYFYINFRHVLIIGGHPEETGGKIHESK